MDTRVSSKIDNASATTSKMVWDLPVRIFHWSLVVLFFTAWFSGEGDRWLDIHIFAGYAIFGLILFRVMWGFLGTHFARFRNFRYSFGQGKEYAIRAIRGHPVRYVGHNPAGSWAIYLLLTGVFLTVFSGFFVFGGEEGHGPAGSLSSDLAGWLAKNIHNGLASLMIALIVVHVAGVVLESHQLKDKLIASMITGLKQVPDGTPDVPSRKGVAAVLVLLLLAYFLSAGIGLVPGKEAFESQFTGQPLSMSAAWQTECGSCHMAYHPTLLASRSWEKLLQQQHQHFGEDLYLDDTTLADLRNYATANSADQGLTEPSRKIMDSMDAAETPLRITETRYWRRKHDDIAAETWQQSNINGKGQCDACHSDAVQGWFEDSRMNIPGPGEAPLAASPNG
jgi:cytochrome b